MSDLISRQAAIDAIARWIGYIDEDMVLRIQTGLKKVPSAQPERKTGEWISIFDEDESKCSVCGEEYYYPKTRGYNYCPKCGADMRGEQDNCGRRMEK